jgi:hypothetical protein
MMPAPKAYLLSWREIMQALNLPTSRDGARNAHRQIRSLNDLYSGPILFRGRGSQPFVDRARLLEWWDRLDEISAEKIRQRRDRQATAGESYPYAASGTVAPGIAGSVRPRKTAS